jgi:SAM-dependent methyltransferase
MGNKKTNFEPDSYPVLYHRHHTLNQGDLHFWHALALEQGDPILELGCGTGRVLVHLAWAGYRTFGLDLQPDMLSFLQNNLPEGLEHPPQVFLADMSAFKLATCFSLILLPCNTFSTLSASMRKKTLENIARHLKKGGRFTFSIPNPTVLLRMPVQGESEVEDIFAHPVDGEPVQVSSAWERTDEVFHLRWHYDHLHPNGIIQRHSVEVKHRIVSTDIYIKEIQAAGLSIESIYGDFDKSSYNNRSSSFILTSILP